MRFSAFNFYFPKVVLALRRLARASQLEAHYSNTMADNPISSAEAIEIIHQAINVISGLRQANRDAVAQMQPLVSANRGLQAAVDRLTSEDSAVDAAVAALRDKLSPPVPTEPVPVVDPVDPVTPAA